MTDNFGREDSYDVYMGRWSRRLAPCFLDWLAMPPGLRWLDVGCGTGALSETILALGSPEVVFGIDPSLGFVTSARRRVGTKVVLKVGSAEMLPYTNNAFDVAVSGLALNFVPDPAVALAEMARVVSVGGTIAAYVWDYAEGMELIRHFWDAAISLFPTAQSFDEASRFSICEPETLRDLFGNAGLTELQTTGISIPTRFRDFDDFWMPFLGGQGPAPGFVAELEPKEIGKLRNLLQSRLRPEPSGEIHLAARAWAVRGKSL